MKEIYLDNSATTRVSRKAAEKAVEIMTQHYGNPSSLHSKGLEAQHDMEAAGDLVAASIGCTREEIFFTSGGTEANNTAVFGAAYALRRRGKRIVTTDIEHSSVREAMSRLEQEGFEIIRLPADINGRVSAEDIKKAITKDTILVSIMAVNNEVGSIQPISGVKRIIEAAASPAVFHADAVQGYLKMPLRPKKYGIDLMTLSGHKIHAPKGVGVLYKRRGVRIIPLHTGGLQQSGVRPGTEPLPLICAMGEAVREYGNTEERTEAVKAVSEYCRAKLKNTEGIEINSPEDALPYIINFSAVGIRSETILHYLADKGIYVSSGSACAKGQKSHVLRAMGLSDDRIDSAVRVSFSDENTEEDIDIFIKELENALRTLARKR